MDIAKNIKIIISDKGLKQKAVAESAGFSASDFSAMVCKRKIIRPEYIS